MKKKEKKRRKWQRQLKEIYIGDVISRELIGDETRRESARKRKDYEDGLLDGIKKYERAKRIT